MKKVIFVADLHIDIGETKRLQAFEKFLATEQAPIYIMGDLFNFWAGNAQGNLGYVRHFLRFLRRICAKKQIFFLAGNRDFLFVPFFAKRLKGNTIEDGYTLTLGKHRVVLYHGDALCTGDKSYLEMKKWLQSDLIYYISRFMPSNVCVKIGQKFRQTSQKAIRKKAQKDMGLNFQFILDILDDLNQDVMICGHTHKPQFKVLREEKDNDKELYVLPECKEQCISYLEWSDNQFTYKEKNYD
ncbi:UDP-2,3-diacylglucosamine diphosphatase [Candidatus Uabimicrobium amorphum]|uniref:UDP-2,3-diacylglucosamine hydrolase n=1 Tax=Uabimicrobium amorphum TaxID=2596890 RepID=A0A5S9ISL0_UABAM|nr:UDP-2,3-diacylglucosamine diphosphatase [Candidatus Uabimicrobium amorphum]BBM87349.1 UDP-2,3-diacylglucosamine hydrolase [Candidatus Uabimicrobium amorphum]